MPVRPCPGCSAVPACTADVGLREQDRAEMVKCIRLCLDRTDNCTATTLRMVSPQTEYDAAVTGPLLETCAATCKTAAATSASGIHGNTHSAARDMPGQLKAHAQGKADDAGSVTTNLRRWMLPRLQLACDGRFTAGHAQMCRLHLDAHDHLTAKIAELDALIAAAAAPVRGPHRPAADHPRGSGGAPPR